MRFFMISQMLPPFENFVAAGTFKSPQTLVNLFAMLFHFGGRREQFSALGALILFPRGMFRVHVHLEGLDVFEGGVALVALERALFRMFFHVRGQVVGAVEGPSADGAGEGFDG